MVTSTGTLAMDEKGAMALFGAVSLGVLALGAGALMINHSMNFGTQSQLAYALDNCMNITVQEFIAYKLAHAAGTTATEHMVVQDTRVEESQALKLLQAFTQDCVHQADDGALNNTMVEKLYVTPNYDKQLLLKAEASAQQWHFFGKSEGNIRAVSRRITPFTATNS